MKLELTKAQALHIAYLVKVDRADCQDTASRDCKYVDKRFCRNSINLCERILEKLEVV